MGGLPQLGFSPDGRHLACYDSRHLCVWDVENKTISDERLVEHQVRFNCAGFSPNVRYLAVGFEWEFVGMLDLSIGPHQTIVAGYDGPVDCVAFSPNGSQLVSVSRGSGYIWNTETWTRDKIRGLYHPERAEFSNDGRLLLIHHDRRMKHYVDASTLKEVDPPRSWVPADITTFPAPRFLIFLSNDGHSLCLKKGGQTIHFCWFPDSFAARSKVAQYKDMVCIGGKRGEVLSIDLAGFEVPDIPIPHIPPPRIPTPPSR